MRQTVKEKLNDKARKMIDLVYDEVCESGEKNIIAAFVDKKTQLKYELTLGLKVYDPDEVVDTQEPVNPEVPTNDETISGTETPVENNDSDLNNPITDPEGTGESDGA